MDVPWLEVAAGRSAGRAFDQLAKERQIYGLIGEGADRATLRDGLGNGDGRIRFEHCRHRTPAKAGVQLECLK